MSNTVVARPYAKAIFEYAKEHQQVDAWARFLEAGRLITQDPLMSTLLRDPTLPADKLYEIVEAIAAPYIEKPQAKLLKLLIENKRLALLPEILAQFQAFLAESEKTLAVDVVSFSALNDKQIQAMKQALKKRLGYDINLQCTVDENILGGAIIRAGDIVIDGSVRSRLNKLREAVIR